MRSIDKTLSTLKHDNNFFLFQIYVDDIIFIGSSHTLMSKFLGNNGERLPNVRGRRTKLFPRYSSEADEAR
jgi:hypothetical protein